MKALRLSRRLLSSFRLHPSSLLSGRRSQVVRQRSAKPLFIGSIPIAASNYKLQSSDNFSDANASPPIEAECAVKTSKRAKVGIQLKIGSMKKITCLACALLLLAYTEVVAQQSLKDY